MSLSLPCHRPTLLLKTASMFDVADAPRDRAYKRSPDRVLELRIVGRTVCTTGRLQVEVDQRIAPNSLCTYTCRFSLSCYGTVRRNDRFIVLTSVVPEYVQRITRIQ
ncbi:hypothetical protein BD626DRAFT_630068, partial [Schizophyllum amplum]